MMLSRLLSILYYYSIKTYFFSCSLIFPFTATYARLSKFLLVHRSGSSIWLRQLAALFISIVVLSFSTESYSEKDPAKDGPPPATGVKIEKVQNETVRESIAIVGSVESPRTSRIGSEVKGIVGKIFIEEGDIVEKGQPLLQLSNSQLKILIMEAKASMNESAALWKKAKKEYERNKQLFEDKVINERLLTNSDIDIEQTEATVKAKKANVALLQDQLKKSTIYSPFTGVIIDKLVEIGEWVDVGRQVFKISQLDPIRITLPVPESVVGLINIGTGVDVQVNAFADRTFPAKVYQIIPEAQTSSRTFPVILVLDNPETLLKIGMMVKAMLPYGKSREILFVPQDAIIVSKGQNIVYIVDENNKAKMIPVKTGIQRRGLIEINGALSPGDKVVTRGGERLMPGMSLKIIDQ